MDKKYVISMIIISASLIGMITLFSWSLMQLATGRIPLNQVSAHTIEVTRIFLILTVILCIGLLLLAKANSKTLNTHKSKNYKW